MTTPTLLLSIVSKTRIQLNRTCCLKQPQYRKDRTENNEFISAVIFGTIDTHLTDKQGARAFAFDTPCTKYKNFTSTIWCT